MPSGQKQPSSVNPDLRRNRIKLSVISNPDQPRFTECDTADVRHGKYRLTKQCLAKA